MSQLPRSPPGHFRALRAAVGVKATNEGTVPAKGAHENPGCFWEANHFKPLIHLGGARVAKRLSMTSAIKRREIMSSDGDMIVPSEFVGKNHSLRRLSLCAVLIGGCSSSTATHKDGSVSPTADGSISSTVDGSSLADLGVVDSFYLNDPPPMSCGLDGGMLPTPPPPGGTVDCPDDKNRERCPCPQEGMTASCWPGLRANRSLGVCKDGMTTCQRIDELTLGWGPCMGYVLPSAGATEGADACKCFSHGDWSIANAVPCFLSTQGQPDGSDGAISTVLNGATYQCPSDASKAPTLPWSTDTITADCEGHFKLCLALKAGDAENPKTTDCAVVTSCTEGDYTMVNMAQPFPPLAGWLSTNTTCAQQFEASGGYGEMSVDGFTVACDTFKRVFNTVSYCPSSCAPGSTDPRCANCSSGSSGSF